MRSRTLHTLLLTALLTGAVHAQDAVQDRLENSTRHHEWAAVTSGDRMVHTFVAYPESPDPRPAVIVIHENRGLTDWVRSFADQLAEAGYVAFAPDLLSGFDSVHERTSEFADADAARAAIYELDPLQVQADLLSVQRYVQSLPSVSERVVVAGFCWGGAQAFRMATYAPGLDGVMVFYGSPPEDLASLEHISAPIYGFYGGDDSRINATIPATESEMNRLAKAYDYRIYDGAGHAFMRSGEAAEASAANRQARDQAWERMLQILATIE